MNNEFFINIPLCTECGGRCCKRMPGTAYPSDFNSPEEIKKAIESGKYAIDWWEGDPGDGDLRKAYFVRPSTKDKIGKIYDATWGGECTFLTKKGCKLKPNKRPKECRDLEPKPDFDCVMHNETCKQKACIAWRKHFDLLHSFREK